MITQLLLLWLIEVCVGKPLQLPLSRTKGTPPSHRSSSRSAIHELSSSSQLKNEFYYYQLTANLGTPGQPVTFLMDTGSSDLWAMASSNPYCESSNFNCSGSVFDPTESRTFHNSSESFQIQCKYSHTTKANQY